MYLKKHLSLILALGLLSSPLFGAQAVQTSLLAQLQNEFPTSYLAGGTQENNNSSVNFADPKEMLNAVKNSARPLTTEEARLTALKMLNSSSEKMILDGAGRKDLELLNQANLHQRINGTNSIVGELVKAKILISPTTDKVELNHRQSIIRTLNNDPHLAGTLEKELKHVGDSERIYLSLLFNTDATQEKLLNQVHYFNWLPFSNKNQVALETSRQIQNAIIGVSLSLPVLSAIGGVLVKNPDLKTQLIGGAAAHAFGLVLNGKAIADLLNTRKLLVTNLQARLIGLGTCINGLREISTLLEQNNIEGFESITELFNPDSKHSDDFKKLLRLLKTNTFRGDASAFSVMGRVLAANKIIQDVKVELYDALEAAGKLDALLSASKLLKNSGSERVQYCFVEFANDNEPVLELNEFWNPLVDPNVVVHNSIKLGGQNSRNMILTGPNTGGKSTVIKGITINIVLAQTFGLAAAKSMVMTPFSVINTNINITDNVKENLSLFAAETARAKQILDSIESLDSSFGFCVFDETFRGTAPEQAEKLSCWYAKELAKHPNTICLHATHYPTMIELEQEASSCKNYKVEITKNEKGSLVRDYKLREGFTLTNVAEDILKEQGLIR